MLHFLKDWWKFSQIHQYYTMALTNNIQNVTQIFYFSLFDSLSNALRSKLLIYQLKHRDSFGKEKFKKWNLFYVW